MKGGAAMSQQWQRAMAQARRIPQSSRPRQNVGAWAANVRRALANKSPAGEAGPERPTKT